MDLDGILNIFNICLFASAFVIAAATGILVCSLKLYHGNLRILLINVSLTHSFALILNLLTEVLNLFQIKGDARIIGYFLSDLCIAATAFNLACLFCERLIAAKFDKRYETMCTGLPWLGLTLVIVDWSIASICAIGLYNKIASGNHLAIMVLIVNAIVLIIFSIMRSLTYKRYASQQTQQISLSQRYQMSENHRSAKFLTGVVCCFGICNFLGALFFLLSKSIPAADIFLFFYSISFVAQMISYPILLILYETKVKMLLRPGKGKRIFIAKSITGKDLIISNVNEQREAYFHSYRKAWA